MDSGQGIPDYYSPSLVSFAKRWRMSEKKYRKVRIKAGKRGWGGPLEIEPKPGKDYIYCVTGGGIHPVAARIAELSGGTAFDGFSSKRDFDQIAVAVIDCGGTARVGVYPMKGVMTVDIHATKPSGPLFRYIKADIFVSGVSVDDIEVVGDWVTAEVDDTAVDETPAPVVEEKVEAVVEKAEAEVQEAVEEPKKKGLFGRLFGG